MHLISVLKDKKMWQRVQFAKGNEMMKFLISAVLITTPVLAPAQQMTEGIARTLADVTPNSVCGAKAVGINRQTKQAIEYQSPGQYVRADGIWDNCPPTPTFIPKIWPRGCRVGTQEWQRFDASMTCRSPGLPGRILDGQIVQLVAQPPTGEYIDGRAIYVCRNSSLDLISSTCNRMQVCYRGPNDYTSDDGGTTKWIFSGLLYDGERAQATELNGSRKRTVQCSGGRFDLL